MYLRPGTIDEAVAALAADRLTILAGGTDFYPARVGKPLDDDILDISRIKALQGIAEGDDHYRIGALTTWTEVIGHPLPPWFDGLKRAAREVGGVQVQNTGTVAGNICNASPAADGVPALITLDAVVDLASAGASRSVPLEDFITGNRETVQRADEMVTAIRVPKRTGPAAATFLKLGGRRYLVISIVMVSALIETADDGTVAAARIAVGACAPVARRLRELETALVGRALSPALAEVAAAAHLAELTPIDDVRGTASYRLDAALTLVRRALAELGGGPLAQP